MEPQVNINSRRDRDRFRCCIDLIVTILMIILAFVLGLIIGALTGLVEFLGTGALIVLAVVLIILVIVRAIMLLCKEYSRRC